MGRMTQVYATMLDPGMLPCVVLLAEPGAALHAPQGAGEEAPISRAVLAEDAHDYYAGEMLSAVVVGSLGVVAAGAGGVLVTRDSDFAKGLGWPLLGLGGLEILGGVAYAISVRGEIEHTIAAFARDPAVFRVEERDHIHGTNSRFIVYRSIEFAMTAAGAGMLTYGLASNRDVWKGAGVATLAVALPIVVIDTFNSARAERYENHLDRFDPSVAIGPGTVSFTGRF
jgi:hypothetical protein